MSSLRSILQLFKYLFVSIPAESAPLIDEDVNGDSTPLIGRDKKVESTTLITMGTEKQSTPPIEQDLDESSYQTSLLGADTRRMA